LEVSSRQPLGILIFERYKGKKSEENDPALPEGRHIPVLCVLSELLEIIVYNLQL